MSKEISLSSDGDYLKFLQDVKFHIQNARLKAALAVNCELLTFYWRLGCMILERQRESKWGDKLINVLAHDLKVTYPDSKGFSPTNLKYMRLFAEIYPDFQISQTVSGQLPWSHHVALMTHAKSNIERIWYCNKAIEEGWSFRKLVVEL